MTSSSQTDKTHTVKFIAENEFTLKTEETFTFTKVAAALPPPYSPPQQPKEEDNTVGEEEPVNTENDRADGDESIEREVKTIDKEKTRKKKGQTIKNGLSKELRKSLLKMN